MADAQEAQQPGFEGQLSDGKTAHKKSLLEFRDVCFSVKVKEGLNPFSGQVKEKLINQNISAQVASGHVLAILGPSGAGKSTLLNALTLNAFGGETTGSVTLDGKPLTEERLRQRGFVVAQQDFHWTFLTCKETLQYAADLYCDEPSSSKQAKVKKVIERMGLESCQGTRVGNEFVKGLSGGQKRRLSLGVALIKDPDLIFLDEPTSGLDAASAAKIMVFVKQLAKRDNLIIVTTIHQPSTSVFNGFDQVMILSQGREAYIGESAKAIEWFAGQGHPIPKNTNPADHCLDLVNADFTAKEGVKKLLDAWEATDRNKSAQRDYEEEKVDPTKSKYRISRAKQMMIMIRRHGWLALRDPTLYLGRCVMMLISCCFFAVVYIKSRNRDQDQVLNKVNLNVWFTGPNAQLAVIGVFVYNMDYKAIRREMRNGMVSPVAYVIASSIMQIPVVFLFAIFSLGVPAYLIADFDFGNAPQVVLMYASCMYCFECMAQFWSIVFDNPLIGMMVYVQIWFTAFIFSGWLIEAEDIIWPLRALVYILPLRFTFRSMIHFEIIDTTYEGCENIPVGATCYGNPAVMGPQAGADVLDKLGEVTGPFSSKSTFLLDVLMPLGLGVAFKLVYAVLLILKTRKATKVLPPKGAPGLAGKEATTLGAATAK